MLPASLTTGYQGRLVALLLLLVVLGAVYLRPNPPTCPIPVPRAANLAVGWKPVLR